MHQETIGHADHRFFRHLPNLLFPGMVPFHDPQPTQCRWRQMSKRKAGVFSVLPILTVFLIAPNQGTCASSSTWATLGSGTGVWSDPTVWSVSGGGSAPPASADD